MRLGDDRWLLVTVGKITEVPEVTRDNPFGNFCSYEVIEKYIPIFGRLIIKLKKGNKFSRYAFNMATFIEDSYVEQILPVKYGIKPFPGYSSININFGELKTQIEDLEWKSKLSAVSGVYLITDKTNNKKYVGSAYGINGIYGRWKTYLNKGFDIDEEESGIRFPNSQLKKLQWIKKKG